MIIKLKRLGLIWIFFIFLIPIAKAQSYLLSECGHILTQSGYYKLMNDVHIPAYPEWPDFCFSIEGNDIILDLNGHTIYGDTSNKNAIFVRFANNVVVKNGRIVDSGINVGSSNPLTSNVVLENITIENPDEINIVPVYSDMGVEKLYIRNLTISVNGWNGIYIDYGNDVEISNVKISGFGYGFGVELKNSENIDIENCELSNQETEILAENVNDLDIINSKFRDFVHEAVMTFNSNNITIVGNVMENGLEAGRGRGIGLHTSENVVIRDNRIVGMHGSQGGNGLWSVNSKNFEVSNNYIEDCVMGIGFWGNGEKLRVRENHVDCSLNGIAFGGGEISDIKVIKNFASGAWALATSVTGVFNDVKIVENIFYGVVQLGNALNSSVVRNYIGRYGNTYSQLLLVNFYCDYIGDSELKNKCLYYDSIHKNYPNNIINNKLDVSYIMQFNKYDKSVNNVVNDVYGLYMVDSHENKFINNYFNGSIADIYKENSNNNLFINNEFDSVVEINSYNNTFKGGKPFKVRTSKSFSEMFKSRTIKVNEYGMVMFQETYNNKLIAIALVSIGIIILTFFS